MLQREVNRWVGRRASTVVVSCAAVRDYCLKQGIAAEKIKVIPGGVAAAAAATTTRGKSSSGWDCQTLFA